VQTQLRTSSFGILLRPINHVDVWYFVCLVADPSVLSDVFRCVTSHCMFVSMSK